MRFSKLMRYLNEEKDFDRCVTLIKAFGIIEFENEVEIVERSGIKMPSKVRELIGAIRKEELIKISRKMMWPIDEEQYQDYAWKIPRDMYGLDKCEQALEYIADKNKKTLWIERIERAKANQVSEFLTTLCDAPEELHDKMIYVYGIERLQDGVKLIKKYRLPLIHGIEARLELLTNTSEK